MRITAAMTRAKGEPFELAELELDEPRDDEIVVEIRAVGLCHTDLVARDQVLPVPLPAVFGHEGAGVVVKAGKSVTKVAPGDRVAITFRSCNHCIRCDAGEPTYCETFVGLNYTGTRPDGSKTLSHEGKAVSGNFFGQSSFATHAITYESNVVPVPNDVAFETLAPLGCAIQTGAGAILRALKCPAGSSIIITGGGSVGLSAAMAANIAGCTTIIVSDPILERRQLALELGATHVHDPADEKLTSFVRKLCRMGCDFALDSTGIGQVMESALTCLRPHGTLGLLGVSADPAQRVPGLTSTVLTFGYTIMGIIEGDSDPDSFIPYLIELHREGRFPFDRLITTYPFAQINQAVEDQHNGKVIKAVLTFAQ